MPPIHQVLIAIDFTDCATAALRQAVRLAEPMPGGLQAVHVIDFMLATELEEVLSKHQRNVRALLLEEARRSWQQLVATVPGAERLPLHVEIGDRLQAIVEQARQRPCGLLILGAYGEQRAHVGFGTVASACVRRAPCDVLLVREGHVGPFRHVIVGIDFSATSRRALERAVEFARRDGARLTLVHLFAPPWQRLVLRAPIISADPSFQRQYRATMEGLLLQLTDEVKQKHPTLPVDCELLEWRGHRSGLVAKVEKVGADLLVLGTRGRGSVRDALLGSTAERVLRDAGSSILAVRPVTESA